MRSTRVVPLRTTFRSRILITTVLTFLAGVSVVPTAANATKGNSYSCPKGSVSASDVNFIPGRPFSPEFPGSPPVMSHEVPPWLICFIPNNGRRYWEDFSLDAQLIGTKIRWRANIKEPGALTSVAPGQVLANTKQLFFAKRRWVEQSGLKPAQDSTVVYSFDYRGNRLWRKEFGPSSKLVAVSERSLVLQNSSEFCAYLVENGSSIGCWGTDFEWILTYPRGSVSIDRNSGDILGDGWRFSAEKAGYKGAVHLLAAHLGVVVVSASMPNALLIVDQNSGRLIDALDDAGYQDRLGAGYSDIDASSGLMLINTGKTSIVYDLKARKRAWTSPDNLKVSGRLCGGKLYLQSGRTYLQVDPRSGQTSSLKARPAIWGNSCTANGKVLDLGLAKYLFSSKFGGFRLEEFRGISLK